MAKTIRNASDLKKALDTAMYFAIEKTQQKMYEIIQDFIKQYYKDYTDVKVYERTYSFFNSLTKSKITKTKDGYYCEVYIDTNQLDYYRHDALEVLDMINRGFHADPSMNGGERIHNGIYSDPYDAPYAIETNNIHFWDDSMDVFNNSNFIINTFMSYAKKRGLLISGSLL